MENKLFMLPQSLKHVEEFSTFSDLTLDFDFFINNNNIIH